jgi:hypothetical protein
MEQLGKIAGISVGIIGGLFILAFFLGAGIGAIKKDNPGEGYLLLGMFVASTLAALLAAYYVIIRKRVQGEQRDQSRETHTVEAARQLPDNYSETISSLTEQTTELLMTEKKTGVREK